MSVERQVLSQGRKYMQEIRKLKDADPTGFLWYGVAASYGYINTPNDLIKLRTKIKEIKESFPEVACAPKERESKRRYSLTYDEDGAEITREVLEGDKGYVWVDSKKQVTDFTREEIESFGYLVNCETEKELLDDLLYCQREGIKAQIDNVIPTSVMKKKLKKLLD